MADEIDRLRARIAELETNQKLSVDWVRGISWRCAKSAEEERQKVGSYVIDAECRKLNVDSLLAIGRGDVYSAMHFELSGLAYQFEQRAAEEHRLPPTPHDLSDAE